MIDAGSYEKSLATLRVLRRMEGAARSLRHAQVGPEHLLLALSVRDAGDILPSVAWRALYQCDLSAVTLGVRIENAVGRGLEESPSNLLYSSRLKKALRCAELELCNSEHSPFLEPEHLLLGLVGETQYSHSAAPNVAVVVLREELGDEAESRIRSTVAQQLLIQAMLQSGKGSVVQKSQLEQWAKLQAVVGSLDYDQSAQLRELVGVVLNELESATEQLGTLMARLDAQHARNGSARV